MSMNLSTYVGPYIQAPKTFDWYSWDTVVSDGRMEGGTDDEFLYLIPNKQLEGVERPTVIDRFMDAPVIQITHHQMVKEVAAFAALASELLEHFDKTGIKAELKWGIVPCWG